jgi:hypothetical protein
MFATSALAEVEFYMTTNQDKVGVEDTFRLEIVVSGAPENSRLNYPSPDDFEVLGRSQSAQMQYVLSGGTSQIKRTEKHILTIRASHVGKLKIPPATLETTGGKTYKTESVTVEVVKGRLQQEPKRAPPQQSPFGFPPGFPFGQLDDDPLQDEPQTRDDNTTIPTTDSDLFLRASIDKKEAFVGEQVVLTFQIFSRIDLQQVEALSLPKLDGFWTVDTKAAAHLQGEQRMVNGVPYRVFMIQQRTLFPMKAGVYTLEPAEVDIVTGNYFDSRKVHRKGNALSLTVKAIPPPPGQNVVPPNVLVGKWRISREVNQTNLSLGEPIQMKVTVAGQGNMQSLPVPQVGAPPSFKLFDPVVKDTGNQKGVTGGQRVIEYTMVPQQTGTFTLPALSIQYFDPQGKAYSESATDAVTITVNPGTGGANVIGSGGANGTNEAANVKNQLVATGLKSLRHTAHFSENATSYVKAPWFPIAVIAPIVLTALFALLNFVRGLTKKETDESRRSKLAKESKKRLKSAHDLMANGKPAEFYGEVDNSLRQFLAAKMGQPLTGLTQAELDKVLSEKNVAADVRLKIVRVFENCDLGRYAPGMGTAERQGTLNLAAESMEALSS